MRTSPGKASPLGIMPLTWIWSALLSPFFMYLNDQLPFNQKKWLPAVLIHTLLLAAFSYLIGWLYFSLYIQMDIEYAMRQRLIMGNVFVNSLPLFVLIATINAVRSYETSRERRLEAVQLEQQLTEARLKALNLQLQPHFLFNTMQGISTLMYSDVKAADDMVHGLSDFLRYVLEHGERHEVSVNEEVEGLGHFMEICQHRFMGRFVFKQAVEEEVLEANIPFLLLQPLVENIFKHGVEKYSAIIHINLLIKKEEENLLIRLEDDGPGLDKKQSKSGTGLRAIQQRLRILYGDQQTFYINNGQKSGVDIRISIPITFQNQSL